MRGAIGVLEIASIAKGVIAADTCLKTAEVEMLLSRAVCPGKYLIVVGGEVSAVKASVEASQKTVEEISDVTILGNIHDDVFTAILGQSSVTYEGSLGIIELFSVPSGILAADICAKAAVVQLVDLQLARGLGGKAVLFITGEIGSVNVAIETIEKQMKSTGLLGATAVIPAPHRDLWKHIW